MMFKALLLQSGYGLSDPALAKQLARDLLFRRFTGLDISESVPGHSTFWRFRQKLEGLSSMDECLREINTPLSEQGLHIKSRDISSVDASVIEAKQCRPDKNKEGHSTQDPEASWNVKAGSDGKRKSTCGYKAHINADEDGLIQSTDDSPGHVHVSNCFTDLLLTRRVNTRWVNVRHKEVPPRPKAVGVWIGHLPSQALKGKYRRYLSSRLISGDESAVYADSAYRSQVHDQWLAERQIDHRIIKRGYRNKPLDERGRLFNRLHLGVRCTVEPVLGVLKLHDGMVKARYMGLGRNRTRFELMCVAHTIRRGLSIQQASCAYVANHRGHRRCQTIS